MNFILCVTTIVRLDTSWEISRYVWMNKNLCFFIPTYENMKMKDSNT